MFLFRFLPPPSSSSVVSKATVLVRLCPAPIAKSDSVISIPMFHGLSVFIHFLGGFLIDERLEYVACPCPIITPL
nr:hypothetical protein CFP56_48338 [Quercus suber]